MKTHFKRPIVMAFPVVVGILIGFACSEAVKDRPARAQATDRKPGAAKIERRFGSVIGLRPEKKDEYIKLHAETWPSVLEQIFRSNIRNYSIYLAELEGKLYLFSYFEYVGDDFEADMKKMADDPETQAWWKVTDPCQIRLAGTPEGDWWKKIPEVFHVD